MKYANIITLKELLNLVHFYDFIVVDEGTHETLFVKQDTLYINYDLKEEYRVNYISSTPALVPTYINAMYEDKSENKPDVYKRPNLLPKKDYCIATQVVIYVSKITNEVLENDK